MRRNLFNQLGGKTGRGGIGSIRENWLIGVPGIVADNEDPEHMHRVRVIIPSIDEDEIYPVWCKKLVGFTGAPGYGDFNPPALDSEVMLIGELGEKHHLYYAPVFNETHIVPADFRSPTVYGFRVPGDYKSIVELDHQIRAGRLHIETDASVRIIAPGGFFVGDRRVG